MLILHVVVEILNALLLEKLSANSDGNLLEDEELISVLAETKEKVADVKTKLEKAVETKNMIAQKREQFRPVATRGSIVYFSIIDIGQVNWMYQISLEKFIELVRAI